MIPPIQRIPYIPKQLPKKVEGNRNEINHVKNKKPKVFSDELNKEIQEKGFEQMI